MKKNKILIPIVTMGAMAAAITPLSTLTGCSEKETINTVIPIDAYVIDKDGVLRGFKDDFVWSESYDTMAFGYGENEPQITKIGAAAFYDPQTNASTIPSHIKHLKFSDTYKDGDHDHIIFGPMSEIGEYAFYASPFEDVVLPIGLRTIRQYAFSHSKVEACYFPPWLNDIGEEAFSYSNLYAVAFNSVFKEFVTEGEGGRFANAPWMALKMDNLDENSCVRHIRKRAFYNCKNLVMHRIPAYCEDNTYEFDEERCGPFAIYDESAKKTVNSNIRVLDYSQITMRSDYQLNHLPQNPIQTFNITINNEPGAKQTDKFIILDDHFSAVGQEEEQKDIYNSIFSTFGAPTQSSFPTNMSNWTVMRATQSKFVIETNGHLTSEIELSRMDDKTWFIPLRYFGESAPTVKTFNSFFPEDTKATVDKIFDDQNQEVYLPNTSAEVYYDESQKKYFLKITLNDSLKDLQTTSLYMSVTIWSRNGFSYTYGYHYFRYVDVGQMDIDGNVSNRLKLIL